MNASNIPTGVTFSIQHFKGGWSGHAQASARIDRRSIEGWHREYPMLDKEPYLNNHDAEDPFVVASWDDTVYWATPEDAFDAIRELVLADVRLVEAAS